jgi:hypothetical protein
MANPRLDRKDPKSIGSIHPPLKVEGGMAVYEQNHHYFDVHGKYLSSHEGYEPGRDVGAAADAVIENVRGMSDEAKMKIARELGFAPAPAKAPSRRKPVAMPETAVTQDPALPGDEDEGEAEGRREPGRPAAARAAAAACRSGSDPPHRRARPGRLGTEKRPVSLLPGEEGVERGFPGTARG